MSDIIHILPPAVANQIAAGEVVQRPASVVKELVENALDAQATLIQVVLEDAGKSTVQVIDNGRGMSSSDALRAFERHATSKIAQATDLFALRTMGFRGEALASIAAVAEVTLRTRREEDELGTLIRFEGSRLAAQEATACPRGANFTVRNLFFNIPARRKFLKSNQTELTNILTEIERVSLANPDIAFTLHHQGNLMIDLPPGNFRGRIEALFGKRVGSKLVPVEVETPLVNVSGYVGMPEAARKKNARQFFFVNNRFMRHPYFAKAIQMAYERLIPDAMQPPFFLRLEVDPARIDVNIHPTKTEIKFEDEGAIFQIILAAVREALGKYGAVPTLDFDTENRPDLPAFPPSFLPQSGTALSAQAAPAQPQIHVDPSFNPFAPAASEASRTSSPARAEGHSTPAAASFASHATAAPAHWEDLYPTPRTSTATPQPALYDALPAAQQAPWNESTTAGQKDFLQVQGRYIATPLHSGLALIDQHRAHIRILYEQYRRQLSEHGAASQRLLFPETIQLSPSEAATLETLLPDLEAIGFDLSPLGGGTYSVLAHPLGTEGLPPAALVQSLLDDALTGQADTPDAVHHHVALNLARRVALPVGEVLSPAEMANLVENLFTCSTPNLTPDGHATLCIIHPEELV